MAKITRFLDSAFGSARNDRRTVAPIDSVPVARSDDLVISTKRSAWRDLITQNDIPSAAVDVAEEEGVVGEAGGGPLLEVAVGAHDGLGGLEDGPQGGEVEGSGRADYHLS